MNIDKSILYNLIEQVEAQKPVINAHQKKILNEVRDLLNAQKNSKEITINKHKFKVLLKIENKLDKVTKVARHVQFRPDTELKATSEAVQPLVDTRSFTRKLLLSQEAIALQPGMIYHVIHDYGEIYQKALDSRASLDTLLKALADYCKEVDARVGPAADDTNDLNISKEQLELEHACRLEIANKAKFTVFDQFIEYSEFKKIAERATNDSYLVDTFMSLFKISVWQAIQNHADLEPYPLLLKMNSILLEQLTALKSNDAYTYDELIKKNLSKQKSIENPAHPKALALQQKGVEYKRDKQARAEGFDALIKILSSD